MIRILNGDCREKLPLLDAGSVQCVVTSPPYYGLRDYNVAGQIGLEATPYDYLTVMVDVFREVRRVLRDDGTVWLNIGDSYAANGARTNNNGSGATGLMRDGRNEASRLHSAAMTKTLNMKQLPPIDSGLASKQLLMMPARLALALQADGWWLRSDIIWHKPNPMPESITDRPTSAHEHVFLLTKAARYYYDADAISEPAVRAGDIPGGGGGYVDRSIGHNRDGLSAACARPVSATRSCRNVWTIATAPFSEAHFATFPPALAERCIKAGSKPGDTILDPFAGAFTAPLVADRLQRDAIGIELSEAYCAMARSRIENDAGMFADLQIDKVR